MAEVVVPKRTYITIGITLLCLTALTAGLSTFDFGQWSGFIAIVIATIKALLVIFFFMHVRYAHLKTIWIILLGGLFWVSILLGLTMTDYLTRQWIGTPGR